MLTGNTELTNQDQESSLNGGFSVTFDDQHVPDWLALLPLLARYDIQATFFVTVNDNLTPDDWVGLKKIQSEGHEIGLHGCRHLNACKFLRTHSLEEYWNTEVAPGMDLMLQNGILPLSYAYPIGIRSRILDWYLLRHFSAVRGVSESQRHSIADSVHLEKQIYKNPHDYGVIYALGIDDHLAVDMTELKKALQEAKDNNLVLTLYAHQPVAGVDQDYQISFDYLEKLFRYARDIGIPGVSCTHFNKRVMVKAMVHQAGQG